MTPEPPVSTPLHRIQPRTAPANTAGRLCYKTEPPTAVNIQSMHACIHGLCSRRWSTFDVWDVAVGGVGRGVGSDSNTGPNP